MKPKFSSYYYQFYHQQQQHHHQPMPLISTLLPHIHTIWVHEYINEYLGIGVDLRQGEQYIFYFSQINRMEKKYWMIKFYTVIDWK